MSNPPDNQYMWPPPGHPAPYGCYNVPPPHYPPPNYNQHPPPMNQMPPQCPQQPMQGNQAMYLPPPSHHQSEPYCGTYPMETQQKRPPGPAPIPPSNYNYGNPPSFHNPVVQQSMCPYSNYNTQERSEPSTSSKYANYNDQNYNDEWDKYKKKPDTQYPSSRKVWPKRDYDHPRGDHKSDYGREARPHQESRRRSKSPHDRDRSNRNYDRNDEDERRHKRYRRNESPDKFHNNHRQSSSARSEYNRPRDRSDSVASSSSRFSRSASVRSSTQSRKSRSKSPTNKLSSAPSSLALVKQRRLTEREALLEKYRQNFCATSQDMEKRMGELSAMGTEGIIENERKIWTRTAPADLYYCRDESNLKIMKGTDKLKDLCDNFKELLINRAANARASQPEYVPPPRKTPKARLCRHKSEACSSSSSGSDSSSSEDENDRTMEELMAKKQHPQRLHPEMWFNDHGEMNDGPLCRCSPKARRSGIRHGIYVGEGVIPRCEPNSNNADRLYHYRITISPPTNFLTKTPTIIKHDEHEFIFEGFSMLSHFPLVKLPTCKVIRFNIEYTILYIDEKLPENFTVQELDYFQDYLFKEVLELVDFDLTAFQDKTGCAQFHFMPRFVRDLPDNGQEILSMNEVLNYLIKSSSLLIQHDDLEKLVNMPQYDWQNFADEVKGMVVTYPGKKPCSVRVDQLDRNQTDQVPKKIVYPEIVHFGIRPPQLSYAGNADYQKAWRDYVKFRHLLANMPKPSFEDKRKLKIKENRLQELRTQSKMKRDVTVDVSSEGFYRTGIMCDIVQHAMLIPVLVCHLRFHKSLDNLEQEIGYDFQNRYLLQLALTHPSYRENFGTNPDHARNSLTNCGIRQPEYGDRRIHYINTRKRGINTLINIMSRFGAKKETESSIAHNERLEFLGDAVVEFLTSIHLFHLFPDLEEGGLATYRASIVQNQHLAVLAKKLNLEQYMLYAHGSDLCHDLELRHAMANCFEALMGSLFLDGAIAIADKVFSETLFKAEEDLKNLWINYPKHPLQEQEPIGDRQWIKSFELLQNLTKFEESIGIEFTHIRLLARAFTDRSIGYTNLTLGSNQRLEFLGDTVLQLIVSEYLYKFFPEHHEGHLSLLRSSLVNNKTQAVVCDDLGMTQYALYGNPKAELKTKDRADLLEAFLGALYVDKGLIYSRTFCNVCFFPRLQDFIMNQDWNDPKSKLQQCCLTLRTMDGGEPDIPVYKVIECKGPTNTRVYTVAVYFQGKRLAKASGHSIQEAEMNSAKEALEKSQDLFPQLDHQKRVIAKSMKMQHWSRKNRLRPMDKLELTYNDSDGSYSARKSRNTDRRNRSRSRDRNQVSKKDRSRSPDQGYYYYKRDKSRDRSGSRDKSQSYKNERSPSENRSRKRDRSSSQKRSQSVKSENRSESLSRSSSSSSDD